MNKSQSKQGVAIVVVLGMLALLMLLGVGFSITMRVERTGAGNYANLVSTRHLVNATLARAMEAIDTEMVMDRASTNHMYPAWHVLASSGAGDRVRLGWGDVMKYVQAPHAAEVVATRSTWLDLAEMEGVKGRGAYLVINESGFVDANYAGGIETRYVGESPGELRINHFLSVLDVTNLATMRTTDYRYETLREFGALQSGYGLHAPGLPDLFSSHSRAPQGSLLDDDSILSDLVYVGDHWHNWTNDARRGDIQIALGDAVPGATLSDVQFIYTNLLDYADEDSVPHHINSPCTEPVPMLNEARIRTGIRRMDSATCVVFSEVQAELFYPFIQASFHTFSVTGTMETVVERTDGGGVAELFRSDPPEAFSVPSGYVPRLITDPTGGDTIDSMPYRVIRPRTPRYTFSAPTNATMRITVNVRATVVVNENSGVSPVFPAGSAVDAITSPIALQIEDVTLLVPGAPPPLESTSLEVIDPRFNWDSSFWRDCRAPAGSTIGAENSWTTFALARGRSDRRYGLDWDARMYVSNRSTLYSAGEFGYLVRGPRSDYFRTIRLYDWDPGTRPAPRAPRDPVLEYFRIDDVSIQRGRVNINTMEKPVIASIFLDSPVGFPFSGVALDPDEVDDIADAMLAWRSDTNAFENVADVGALDWRGIAGFGSRPDIDLESLIIHNCRHMTTRHNLFTILLSARPFSMGLGTVADRAGQGDWMGAERAVAQVWRDPFPDSDGRHRWIVHYFKWIGAD